MRWLADLMGDFAITAPVLAAKSPFTPRELFVSVTRVGEEVLFTVANADPIWMRYQEAMRTGLLLAREGVKAARLNQPVEVGVKHHKLIVNGKTAVRIGRLLLARGAECKYLCGDGAKRTLDIG